MRNNVRPLHDPEDVTYFVSEMMKIVGKKNKKIEKRIREEFQLSPDPVWVDGIENGIEEMTYTRLFWVENDAISFLLKSTASHSSMPDDLGQLSKQLHACARIMRKKDVSHAFIKDAEDAEDAVEDYKRYYSDIQMLHMKAMRLLKRMKNEKGRPKLNRYDEYAAYVLKLFCELSGDTIRLFRHDQYDPITPAHRFLWVATALLNGRAKRLQTKTLYTAANVYNACDKARKMLRTK